MIFFAFAQLKHQFNFKRLFKNQLIVFSINLCFFTFLFWKVSPNAKTFFLFSNQKIIFENEFIFSLNRQIINNKKIC